MLHMGKTGKDSLGLERRFELDVVELWGQELDVVELWGLGLDVGERDALELDVVELGGLEWRRERGSWAGGQQELFAGESDDIAGGAPPAGDK